MPMLFCLMVLNYLDRNALAGARVQGIEADLGMEGTDFNVAISVLFAGYICGQLPSNMILSKSRPSIYLSCCVMLWCAMLLARPRPQLTDLGLSQGHGVAFDWLCAELPPTSRRVSRAALFTRLRASARCSRSAALLPNSSFSRTAVCSSVFSKLLTSRTSATHTGPHPSVQTKPSNEPFLDAFLPLAAARYLSCHPGSRGKNWPSVLPS